METGDTPPRRGYLAVALLFALAVLALGAWHLLDGEGEGDWFCTLAGTTGMPEAPSAEEAFELWLHDAQQQDGDPDDEYPPDVDQWERRSMPGTGEAKWFWPRSANEGVAVTAMQSENPGGRWTVIGVNGCSR